jgi:TRAP-type C4-dicarboxylate transport system substrate-binding protein
MKKRLFVLLYALMFLVMILGTASTAASAPAKPVELKLGHAWATTHHVHVILDQWAKDVEKATDGRVKITIYPGGTLSTAVQLYDSVRTGVVDLAWFLQGYTPGKFPLTSVVELPFMASSARQGSAAIWELYENSPEMQAEYGGVKVLSVWVVDTGQLMTNRKVVRNTNDIKGMKLRIGSDTLKPTAEALGAVPILMAINELYDALQKGVVDGTLLGTSAIRTFKLGSLLKGVTIGHFFVNVQALGINRNSWARIPAKDQKIVMDLAGLRLAQITGSKYDSEGKVGYDDAQAAGAEMVQLPPAEMAKWKDAVGGIYQKWISDTNAKKLPGQQIYNRTRELLKKHE